MKKPIWKSIENVVEENEFFIVEKKEIGYIVYNKQTDSVFQCEKYTIVGSTLIYKDINGSSFVSNEINQQRYGQGNILVNVMEISSWGYKTICGSKQLYVKYLDEKGFKFIRLVDENGNLYKKPAKKLQETEVAAL